MIKYYKFHDKFFEIAKQKECFAKVVFNDKITDDEVKVCCDLANKYNLLLVLQPAMIQDKMSVSSDFCEKILDKFLNLHNLILNVSTYLEMKLEMKLEINIMYFLNNIEYIKSLFKDYYKYSRAIVKLNEYTSNLFQIFFQIN